MRSEWRRVPANGDEACGVRRVAFVGRANRLLRVRRLVGSLSAPLASAVKSGVRASHGTLTEGCVAYLTSLAVGRANLHAMCDVNVSERAEATVDRMAGRVVRPTRGAVVAMGNTPRRSSHVQSKRVANHQGGRWLAPHSENDGTPGGNVNDVLSASDSAAGGTTHTGGGSHMHVLYRAEALLSTHLLGF